MKKIIINSILLTCLAASPSLLFVDNVAHEVKQGRQTRWIQDNTDFDHPEKMYKQYFNVDRDVMPWDLFGDWTTPERIVDVGTIGAMWMGSGDFYYTGPIQPSFSIQTAYFNEQPDNNLALPQERTNWHETYQNFFNYLPDEEGVYWNGSEWTTLQNTGEIGDNTEWLNVTSRTPMRGIIPFWENTSQFNSYVLSETNNGTTDSTNLTFESSYAAYIDNYTSSTETTYPVIYKYLENPDLLYDIYITNDDSVEWILPEDYKLVEYDDLTNAFVGIDSNWNILSFAEYMFDFLIWNWNENVYPTKSEDASYTTLKPIDATEIDVELYGWSGRISLKGDGYANMEVDPSTTIDEFDTISLTVANGGYDGTYTIDDINEWNQAISIVFYNKDEFANPELSPSYRWGAKGHWYSPYDGKDDYYEMYNPFKQQMNVNINPTLIDFNGLNQRFEEAFISNEDHKYFIETTLAEFRTEFEDWLWNSDNGLNKYFIDYYSDCHVNDYYNNMGGDGRAFLGHNRFQSGIYPVEDLREGDVNISYTDQNGEVVTDEMRLGDVNQLNITIEFNEASDNAKLFETTSTTPETITFDTSSLNSKDPIITPEVDDDGGTSILLILIITLLILTVVGAIIAVLVLKNRK